MTLANESPDIAYPSALDRQTLAEDARYQSEVSSHRPTVFFRPGDRTTPAQAGYWEANEDGTSFIRFVAQYGNHAEGKRPTFREEVEPVRVLSRAAKRLRDVFPEECGSAYAELADPHAVLAYLQQKYPERDLNLDSTVTVYTVGYIE